MKDRQPDATETPSPPQSPVGRLARLRAYRTENAGDVPDEPTLIWRARDGDRDAFAALYSRHRATIARYVGARVSNPAEAEDITEAIFESAWRAMRRYHEQGVPFLAWLYRLAHNRVIDHYRAQRPTLSLIPEVHETIAAPDALLDLYIDANDISKAMIALTGDQRQVVILRFVHGMSGREVAQVMGKREDAVRALQFRALATLRKVLAGQEP